MSGFLNSTYMPPAQKPPTIALNFLKEIQEKEYEKQIMRTSPKRLNFSPSKIIKGQSSLIQSPSAAHHRNSQGSLNNGSFSNTALMVQGQNQTSQVALPFMDNSMLLMSFGPRFNQQKDSQLQTTEEQQEEKGKHPQQDMKDVIED